MQRRHGDGGAAADAQRSVASASVHVFTVELPDIGGWVQLQKRPLGALPGLIKLSSEAHLLGC